MALSKLQKEGLKQYLNFINTPLPEREEDWSEIEKQITRLYRKIDPDMPPLPRQTELRMWIQCVHREARILLQQCCGALTIQKEGYPNSSPFRRSRLTMSPTSETISVFPVEHPTLDTRKISIAHHSGAIHFEVREKRLVPVYRQYEDPTSAFLLMLVNLLIWLDDLSKITQCTCNNWFYKVKRQEYCSRACKEKKNPSRDRTKEYRVRRGAWESFREDLNRSLEQMQTLKRNTAQQALKQGEGVFRKAESAFKDAFPRNVGKGYKEGMMLLARAKEQIKRLHRQVKGY